MGHTLTEVNDSPAAPSGATAEAVLTEELRAELVAFRRDLHRHPELGRQEFRTTEKVRARLALAGLTPEARSGEAATEIRWQIEELRVSLFAQTIGTPLPVSERRIMTAIEQLS